MPDSRTPPHNFDAEEAVLSSLMILDADRYDAAVATGIGARHFWRPSHQHIFGAIAKAWADGTKPDPLIVAEVLRAEGLLESVGGLEAIHELILSPASPSSVVSYATTVVRLAGYREVLQLSADLSEAAYAENDSALSAAKARLDGIGATGRASWRERIIDGRTWLASGPATVTPRWGDETDCLAAVGQPTLIVGESGAGKTTLVDHLVLGACGVPEYATVLGWPVRPVASDATVLLLAADRPEQARLALRRLVTTGVAWEAVERRLRVWPGPPPESLAANPGLLVEMAIAVGAELVVIDSEKDMAMQLSDERVGAAINTAHQMLVADGRDVYGLHHPRKRGREFADTRPTIADVYGSAWITHGAGSVLFLIEEPMSTEAVQVKTPNGREANFRFRVVRATGAIECCDTDAVLAAVQDAGPDGISTKEVARWVLGIPDPTEAQIEQMRRRLRIIEAAGAITTTGSGKATRWVET